MSTDESWLDHFEVIPPDRDTDPDDADGALALMRCLRCGVVAAHIDADDTFRDLKDCADFHWYDCIKVDA